MYTFKRIYISLFFVLGKGPSGTPAPTSFARTKASPWRGRWAGYNLKCNTQNKKRQYANLSVKCSYHTNKLHGGKHIVLHTFYTG